MQQIKIKRRKRIGERQYYVKIKNMSEHKSNGNLIVLKVAMLDDLKVEREFCLLKDSYILDKLIDSVMNDEDYDKEYTQEDFIGETIYITTSINKKGFLNIIDISKEEIEENNDTYFDTENLLDEMDFEEDDFIDIKEQESEFDDLF